MQTRNRRNTRPPSYRRRPGYTQALVTLTDAVTGRRKDCWLGEYGTPASREAYHRTVAQWEARGRRMPLDDVVATQATAGTLSISQLVREYWGWAKTYYTRGHLAPMKVALRLLRQLYGSSPASEFGPAKLRLLREAMIHGDREADPPRRPWARKTINQRIGQIRHVFKWGTAQQLVSATIHQALSTLEPLKRGRSGARETEKIGPAPQHVIDEVRPLLHPTLRALVDLQLLTGARPGELLLLRPCDVAMDETAGVWSIRPLNHKNAYRDKERVIYLGPRAQETLRPFLSRSTTTYCFCPIEVEAHRCNGRRTGCPPHPSLPASAGDQSAAAIVLRRPAQREPVDEVGRQRDRHHADRDVQKREERRTENPVALLRPRRPVDHRHAERQRQEHPQPHPRGDRQRLDERDPDRQQVRQRAHPAASSRTAVPIVS